MDWMYDSVQRMEHSYGLKIEYKIYMSSCKLLGPALGVPDPYSVLLSCSDHEGIRPGGSAKASTVNRTLG